MSEQALAPVIPLPVLPEPDWAAAAPDAADIEAWERKINPAVPVGTIRPALRVVR